MPDIAGVAARLMIRLLRQVEAEPKMKTGATGAKGDKGGKGGNGGNGTGNEVTTSTDSKELREVMFVSRDWSQMEGRWFWGDYEEFGIDLTLRRIDAAPIIIGLDRFSLKSPSIDEQVTIFGANQ